MSKAWGFGVSACQVIFLHKSLPLGPIRWKIVIKVVPVTALCLFQPPWGFGQFGLFWSVLEPVSPFFWAQKGLNGPKNDTVGQGNYHTWLVGAFGAHFGPLWKPFRSDFRDQSKIVGPIWSLFLTRLAAKNDFNGPKTDTGGQGNYHTWLVGSLGPI